MAKLGLALEDFLGTVPYDKGNSMKLTFWGVRGSIPSPISNSEIRYKITEVLKKAVNEKITGENQIDDFINTLPALSLGTTGGNTACVEVRASNNIIVFDSGTGIRVLGYDLMSGEFAKGEGTVHIFLSHTHWDHINGFPFFIPAYIKGNSVHIYGCHPNLEERFRNQHNPLHFPVHIESLLPNIEFHTIKPEEDFVLGDCTITPISLHHPGGSFGYRVEHEGKKIAYATDSEYKDVTDKGLKKYLDFFNGCDVLIFDAMYTLSDSLDKEDWGHSSSLIGAEIAMAAKIKKLILFHHDPTHDDRELQDILNKTIKFIKKNARYECEAMLAREGLTLEI